MSDILIFVLFLLFVSINNNVTNNNIVNNFNLKD